MRWLTALLVVAACAKQPHDFHAAGKLPVSACAAYLVEPASHAVVVQPDGKPGEFVDYKGRKFNVHRGDCVTIAQPTIHWFADAKLAYVGLGDSAALGARSEKRISQYDALYAGDTLLAVSRYESVMRDTLWLVDSHQDEQAKLFTTLTGAAPSAR
jgi:hypothetical protein